MVKKGGFFLVAIALALSFLLSSCGGSNGGGGMPDFVGTWSATQSGETVTFVFTTGSLSVTASGVLSATWDCSFQSVDENAKHIQMVQTSATGLYASLFPNGTVLYMTYRVDGNSIYLKVSDSGYPPTA